MKPRERRREIPLFLALAIGGTAALPAAPAPLASQEPGFVVEGVVRARAEAMPIRGATVTLEGFEERISGVDGRFRFEGIPAGRHTLRVRVLGYRSDERVLDVRSDADLRIDVEVQPIPLDTLSARSWSITLSGRVSDGETGRPLLGAEVTVPPNRESVTGAAGRFRFGNVPASAPTVVEVRAFGYLPERVIVASADDATLDFALPVDPLVQRMIARESARLEERARSHPAMTRRIDREALLRRDRWSAWDLVSRQLPATRRGRIDCLILDEREIHPDVGLQNYLQTFTALEIEQIEVLTLRTFGTLVMVRVYTRDFMRRMIGGGVELPPITLVSAFGRPLCR